MKVDGDLSGKTIDAIHKEVNSFSEWQESMKYKQKTIDAAEKVIDGIDVNDVRHDYLNSEHHGNMKVDGDLFVGGKIESLTIDNVDRLKVVQENPIDVVNREVGYASLFKSWGFIGDSLSSGTHEYFKDGASQSTNIDLYYYSWGQYICRLTGAEGYNFSEGGQTAKGWIEGKHGWEADMTTEEQKRTWIGAKTNLKQVYTIALGENDHGKYAAGYAATDIGTYDSTTDIDTNAPTYIGYIAGIIQRIKSVNSKAKFFVLTEPKFHGSNFSDYNEELRKLPQYFNDVYIVDLEKYQVEITPEWSSRYRLGFHLNALGYLYTAYIIMQCIDAIIRSHFSDFAQIAFIGTNYKYK